MKIDHMLIRKVAQLARLELSEEEVAEFTPQLKEVLDSFSALDDIDLKDLKPSFQPVALRNSLRDDTITASLTKEQALSNAKHTKDGYFKGPKVI